MATKNQGETTGRASERYMALIQEVPLRPIRSEKGLDRAIARIDTLSDRGKLASDEHDYMLVLASLIEEYEEEHHPMPPVSGGEMLRYLIETKELNQVDVAAATGIAESTLSEILNGKRALSAKYMPALARYFRVNPGVFVSD
jgi:HTH-type transcriptional regulator/antitoxin HigA